MASLRGSLLPEASNVGDFADGRDCGDRGRARATARRGTIVATNTGMSLRDYFAAEVMAGVASAVLTNPDAAEGFTTNAKEASITTQRALAVYCYAIADAMLAERAKGKPE